MICVKFKEKRLKMQTNLNKLSTLGIKDYKCK